MQIKILCPLWGHEHLNIRDFLEKIKNARFDGIDTWIPTDKKKKAALYNFLQKNEMLIVSHQHAASGKSFTEFKKSFLKELQICAEPQPVLINSHTGRDFFSNEQNLELIDIAENFTAQTGITVAHETHRGRMGFSPGAIDYFLKSRNAMRITADFSHWVCVTESLLQGFGDILTESINRTVHVHARVGFEEGPQVPDPRAPEWQYAVEQFFVWWGKIVAVNKQKYRKVFTFTTEFGPPPYLPVLPFTKQPVADQFDINCYIKDLLRKRFIESAEN